MCEEFPHLGILPKEALLDESGNIRGLSRFREDTIEISLPVEFQWDATVYAMGNMEDTDCVYVRQTVNLVTYQSINWVIQKELDEDCFVSPIEEDVRQYNK